MSRVGPISCGHLEPRGTRRSAQRGGGLTERHQSDRTSQSILPEVGAEGQARLGAAVVVVVGAGGLGCAVLQYLAAAE